MTVPTVNDRRLTIAVVAGGCLGLVLAVVLYHASGLDRLPDLAQYVVLFVFSATVQLGVVGMSSRWWLPTPTATHTTGGDR